MKIRRSLALLVLVSSLSSSAARAQATQDNSSGGADSARTELEGKAVGLLEDALEEARGLKLPENRVRAETVAAGLLWTRDEQAARAAFKSAADAVAALTGALDPEDPDFYNAAQAVASMRTQLLQTVASHDPKLALALLAPSDFDRARSDARNFRRADARADAQLTLAESLLNTVTARRPSQRFNRRVQSMSVGGGVVIDRN